MRGDLTLDDRLDRIENKLDRVYSEVHKNRLVITGLKIKVATFGAIAGAMAGLLSGFGFRF